MNHNIKNTTQEVQKIIQELKTKVDNQTTWTGTEKADLEKRITHLLDKQQPQGTVKLDTDLGELEQLDTVFTKNQVENAKEIKKLKDDLNAMTAERDAETAKLTAKETELTNTKTELANKVAEIAGLSEAKITQELITKLDTLSASAYDPAKIAEIKTLLEAVKTETDKPQEKIDVKQLKEEIKKDLPKEWSIWGILVSSGLGLIGIIYLAISKNSTPEEESKEKLEVEL